MNFFKLIVLYSFLFIITKSYAAPFSGGDGSLLNPYQIRTAENLSNIRNYLGSANADLHFRLMNDIDLTIFLQDSAKGWLPIGDTLHNIFFGALHGGGHKITGLWINRPTQHYVGLFSLTLNAFIDSLGVEVAVNDSVSGNNNVGCLSGGISAKWLLTGRYTTVNHCYATGMVSGKEHVGVFTGIISIAQSSKVSECYSSGIAKGTHIVGGFTGYNSVTGEVCQCYSTANVYGSTTVGGFTGNVNSLPSAIIKDCYATGDVTGNSAVGGFVGNCNTNGRVSHSYATGKVSGNNDTGGFAGTSSGWGIDSCYFDKQTTQQPDGIGSINYPPNTNIVYGKTTSEMLMKNTFVGWDFSSTWAIYERCHYPYFMWQKTPATANKNTNTNLLTLAANDAEISPDFHKDSLYYTATVYNYIDKISLAGTPECELAEVIGNVNNAALEVGNNIFLITVKAEDTNYKKTYTVNITRSTENPTDSCFANADLTDIVISNGTLSPSFDKDSLHYVVHVPNTIANISITGIADCDSALVSGNVADTGLEVGYNSFNSAVIDKYRLFTKTYSITIIRSDSTPLLLDITTDYGNLTPAFSSSIFRYTIPLNCNIRSATLNITAQSEDSIDIKTEKFGSTADYSMTLSPYTIADSVVIIVRQGKAHKTYIVGFTAPLGSEVIYQAYPNMIEIITNPNNNGGYSFVKNDFTWLLNDAAISHNASAVLYIPSGFAPSGIYSAIATLTNGTHINICGIQPDTYTPQEIRIFPNPTSKQLTIDNEQWTDSIDDIPINIYNVYGTLAAQYMMCSNQMEIDISTLPRGIYFLKINGETIKIIKQ